MQYMSICLSLPLQEQYIFCYRAISEYVSSLDQYSNFV